MRRREAGPGFGEPGPRGPRVSAIPSHPPALRPGFAHSGTHRPGYVLYIVLVVVVVLSLVAYQYSDAMSSEAAAAARAHDLEQARANAYSGVYLAAAALTDPNYATATLDDNPTLFSAQVVGTANQSADRGTPRGQGDSNLRRGGGRVSLLNLSDPAARKYGLEDESRKLNVNALILSDPVGNVLHDALMMLPNMTEEVADSIVDWVDADQSPRPSGTEDYSGNNPPYRAKNGPLSTIDELLLVKGVTPDLLYGADRNQNGVQDSTETGGDSGFDRGWSEYLTCYGRELNVDSAGVARINLNGTDLKVLDEQLMALDGMTREVADYLLYYRISGTGETYTPTLAQGLVAAEVAELRPLVQSAIDNATPPRRRFTSVLTVLNTQVRLPQRAGGATATLTLGGGAVVVQQQQQMVTPVVPSPLNDAATLGKLAAALLDKTTASDDYEMVPRVNVNTAPRQVIACLPGLTEADVTAVVSNRPEPGTDQTSAWLVTKANLEPGKFKSIEKYITGRSGAYRVRSVGYFGSPGGPVASAEAVIEVVAENADSSGIVAKPRIVYFRDTTDLGRVFDDLPR